jgi:integrase
MTNTPVSRCLLLGNRRVRRLLVTSFAAGVDVSIIALWLGHANTHSTDAYLHADMAIKQAAMDRTRPPTVKPGSYQPEPDILAWLTSL